MTGEVIGRSQDAPGGAFTTPRLPAADGVVGAYMVLEQWARVFDPPDPSEPAARRAISDASGACVVLRQRGRVLGVGTDTTGDALMLRRAAGRAMSMVLADRTVVALPPEARAHLGRSLTVELEVAGPLVPMPGRTYASINEQLEPGLDGVAMRRDDRLRVLFPAQLRISNTAGNVERLLPSLAVELGLPARELGELAGEFGLRVYRFRTIHLVQRGPGRRPRATFRGDQIVPATDVNRVSIDAFAEGLVDHLATSLWSGDEPLGLMGDYHPARDDYSPLVAPPRDQALVAFAAARYAETLPPTAPQRDRVLTLVDVLLLELADVGDGEIDALTDPVACAAIVLAAIARPEARREPTIALLLTQAIDRVRRAAAAAGRDGAGGPGVRAPRPPSPHGQAMVAAALARILRAGDRDPAGPDAVATRHVINAAWQSVPEHRRVTLLPWIAWAEADYAAATGEPPVNTTALRSLRALLNGSRIGAATSEGAPDLYGGFSLSGRGQPRATAQSARPAAFLATALRNPALTTPAERPVELDHQLETMRFLVQLSVRDSHLWAFPGPTRAKGGIRAATWDSDQPVAAQAMGLLAAAETLLSLD